MILITGAGKGIGQFLYQQLRETEDVVGTTFTSATNDPKLTTLDVKDFAAVEKWKNSLGKEKLSKLKIINCAGVSYNAFAHKADLDAWQNVIETNVFGTFNVIRAFLPAMREQGFGRIVNFGSVVAQRAVPGTSAYATSKAALWGLTKSLAVENASKGVTVNTINLGYSDIGMGLTEIPPAHREELMKKIPSGRFASADEILKTVRFFFENEYVNGTAIDLSGALV